MTKDEALKLALEALESGVDTQIGLVAWTEYDSCLISDAITAVKEALDVPETNFGNIAQPAPIISLECANCQLTIQQLNDKVMRLMAQPAQEMVATMTVEDGRISFAAKILPDGTYDLYTTPPAAQPAQEPVAWIEHHKAGDNLVWEEPNKGTPLYTTPPQRPWVSLTAQEAANCWTTSATQTWKNFEAALKEKNGL